MYHSSLSKIKNLKTNNKELEEEFFEAKQDPTFKEIVDKIDLDDKELMKNKENGTKRPCYFCFRDRKNKEIIWFVPISTKYEIHQKIHLL